MALMQQETAQYLASLTLEMTVMADSAGFEVLAHLYRMAQIEAELQARPPLFMLGPERKARAPSEMATA